MSPADQVLFERWQTQRDPEAFQRLAEKYAGMIYAIGRRITGNAQDAEDVAQAAFETLASQPRAPKVHLGAWLHRVATYRALSLRRGEHRRKEREARYAAERPRQAEIGWNDIYDLVDEAIAALPDKQRDAVVAHYLEGKTHEQIAQDFGISRPAVTQRIHGGVSGLRAALRKRGVAVPMAALGALVAHGADAAASASLVARLGRIGLSGYVGAETGIGLWQTWVAALGGVKMVATGALMALVAAGAGFVALVPASHSLDDSAIPVTPANLSTMSTMSTTSTISSEAGAPEGPTTNAAAHPAPASLAPAVGGSGARITGVVVDTAGNPVAGAQVRLRDTEDLRKGAGWVSEDDGSFEFDHVVPVEACWVGADIRQEGGERRSGQAELKPVLSGESYEVTLTLYDGVIAGRVLDDHARPMPDVEVLASPQWYYRFGLPAARTDAGGHYRITGVMEGEYEMQIKPVEGSYMETGVKVRSDGVGVRTQVNLVCRTPEGGVIAGTVTNEAGEPIERAYVAYNLTEAPHTSAWIFTDAGGRYVLQGVPDGPNLIRALHFDYGELVRRDIAANGDPVDFMLPRKGAVRGQVVRADTGEPITDFEIHTWEPSSDIHYFMVSERWKPYSDAGGRFSLLLKPGDQPLRVRAKGFGEATQTVLVPPGSLLEDVLVALKPARALRGTVADAASGASILGARIYLGPLPLESERTTRAAAVSGDAGEFAIPDIEPEELILSATHPAYAPAWTTAGAGETEVALMMRAGLEVTGTVSINGRPAEGVPVRALAPGFSESALASTASDADGRFTLTGLPREDVVYCATLSGEDRTQYFQPGESWRANSNTVDFDFLRDGARFQLAVDEGGLPQPGLTVTATLDLGDGFTDVVEGRLDQRGTTTFTNLAEGRWTIRVYPRNAERAGQPHELLAAPLHPAAFPQIHYDIEDRTTSVFMATNGEDLPSSDVSPLDVQLTP